MSNKAAGNRFEREFSDLLAENGFWVHRFQDNKNGQPCDVIAARNGRTYLFDCKDCQGESFPLRRMEENQYNAMHLFELTGNRRGMFAVRFSPVEIWLIDYWKLAALRSHNVKSIGRADLKLYGKDFWAWLNTRNKMDGWDGTHADHHWK